MGVLAPGRCLIPGSRFPTGSLGSSRPTRAPVCFWGQDRPSSKAGFPSFHAKDAQPRFPGPLALHAWRAGCAGSVCYRRKDLWKVSLRDCRNVSVFLAPSVLPLLEDKLRAELPAGARVVSGRFPLPTWQPVAVAGEGLDRVWAYDVPGGGQAGEAVSSRIPIQAAPRPSSACILGAPVSQAS
ncbi:PREDICTED: protein FAM173A [Mandrillus leucophaeus]|uniref:Adenine nucleotide translocase lysine methyltransferase n=1 Tax=Mandrillus leucophaeus TaxID=9568 RepID=A0A2K6AAW7_MANLE|nr:PREDICTED: protein FAM173A [Mandrillus leucophaeus]